MMFLGFFDVALDVSDAGFKETDPPFMQSHPPLRSALLRRVQLHAVRALACS